MSAHRQRFKWAVFCAVAFALMAIVVRSGGTEAFDFAGLCWMESIRSPGLTSFFLAITAIGGGTFLAPLSILVSVVLFVRGHRQDGKLYLGSTLVVWAVYVGLKATFARPRPDLIPRLSAAGWWSFPSGHAMLSTFVLGSAVILLTKSPWLRALGAALILLIVTSRVYLGVHYPSDVIAGVLGGSAGVAVVLGIREKRLARPSPG